MQRHLRTTAFILSFIIIAFTSSLSYAMTAEVQRQAQQHNDNWGFVHKEGIVLVLSGGGTKGLAHIGVLEVLERENIPIAAIVGTSMGAIMGGIYASGYTAKEIKEVVSNVDLMEIISDRSSAKILDMGYNKQPTSQTSMLSLQLDGKKLPRGKRGALRAKDLYSFLSELTERSAVTDFNMLPIPFAAVATNLETGETVILRKGNLASALRASLSIPGIFEPWEMNGRLLVDGGLKANLPVLIAKKLFPGHPVIAINLSPEDITKPQERLRSVLEVSAQTVEILMVEQIRANAAEADLVIAPDVKKFGILDSGGYDKIIERGAEAAESFVGKLHAILTKYNETYCEYARVDPDANTIPTVIDIRFEGIPESIAKILYEKFDDMIGQPLDMKKVSRVVKTLSEREDFTSVEGRTQNYTKDTVALVFAIERPSKIEIGVSGYVGNVNPDSWLSLSAQIHDILIDGDVGSMEFRLGTKWGAMLRYFTPRSEEDSQFGLVLVAREEGTTPRNAASFEFERYIARIAWYKNLGSKTRIGLGYALETSTYMDKETLSGPYFNLSFNNLDDPIMPTKGISVTSDIWFPLGETVISQTIFQSYLPVWEKWKVIFSGGLKTGDGDDLAYAALLGSQQELYSLSNSPLVGDQAYWLHLGAAQKIMKSWWGGIVVEIFGNYGQVMREWDISDSWWETGIALSVPTNNFSGKFLVVYDQGGQFTFGYSIGIPQFWSGPIP